MVLHQAMKLKSNWDPQNWNVYRMNPPKKKYCVYLHPLHLDFLIHNVLIKYDTFFRCDVCCAAKPILARLSVCCHCLRGSAALGVSISISDMNIQPIDGLAARGPALSFPYYHILFLPHIL